MTWKLGGGSRPCTGHTEAYDLVKSLAQRAMDTSVPLEELAAADSRLTSLLEGVDLEELFRPDFYLRNVSVSLDRVGLKEKPKVR